MSLFFWEVLQMKKTIILYFSQHHGNTEKLVQAIGKNAVRIVEISKAKDLDLKEYDLIGIASGIYGGNFGKPMMSYVQEHLPEGKDIFLLYTYAKKMGHYTNGIRKIIEEKKGNIVGEYSCQGYNTFGPFKLIGGTGKNHPTKEEIEGAVSFYKKLR